MACADLQLTRRKSNPVILPPLKLNYQIPATNNDIIAHGEMRIITPHTPPSDNPNALLKDKLTKRISDKLLGIHVTTPL